MVELPSTYTPFDILEFCSNRLLDVSVPILYGQTPVCLIGKNGIPLVWLSAPTEPGSRVWIFVVKESKALNPGVDVIYDERIGTVVVQVVNRQVLRVKKVSADRAVVDILDLRPLGLNVYGTGDRLMVGGTTLSSNTFENVRTAIALEAGRDQ